MIKDEYILRSLAKIRQKKWELYAISRILHRLDDPDIEFVCQQLVRFPDGRRALTDIYFPQFNLHVEIDERHHFDEARIETDALRSREIVEVAEGDILRIPVYQNGQDRPLREIADSIDQLVDRLKRSKQKAISSGSFEPWDFEHRYLPDRHIAAGEININSRAVFRNHRDALRCFGYQGGTYQRGIWLIPGTNSAVWFPKLYDNGAWRNSLSPDGKTIIEKELDENALPVPQRLAAQINLRKITFAHVSTPMEPRLYRFIGVFMINLAKTMPDNTAIFECVGKRVCLKSPDRDLNDVDVH